MSFYRLIGFAHVVCALGTFAALALEGLSLGRLARAKTAEEATQWTAVWKVLPSIGMPALLGALATGSYLATAMHGWSLGWTQLAMPALVLVAVAGAVVGPARNRVAAEVAQLRGSLPAELRARLAQPRFEASYRFRAVVLLGVVFAMTVKPVGAAAWLTGAVTVALAVLAAAVTLARRPGAGQPDALAGGG